VRPEIQALRAAAVALVVIYHFWPSALPGGFVGVDVFFAISGFLITSHLLREIDRTGTVSLPGFWARRARRILPAALVVLLLCAVATVLFVPMNYWQQFFTEMRASSAYGQNWHLAATAVDYTAADNAPSLVQHYWSLSAEEQFYIVWPVLIVLALAVSRSRRSIVVVMSALTALSLAYSIHHTAANPAEAYFVTPTRAWEFGLGGLLALLPHSGRFPDALRSGLSWLGIGAIAVAGLTYSDSTAFPGYTALLPVLGALAVIVAGAPALRWAPTPAIGLKPVQFLGDISYSVYLWHWPLLILAPFVIGGELHGGTKACLIALTIAAAWVTKQVVEDPCRRGAFLVRHKARWTFTAAAAATALVIGASFGGASYVQAQIREDARESARILASNPPCFGAAARDPEKPCSNPELRKVVVPTPLEARDRPNAPCKMIEHGKRINVCAFGVPAAEANGTIALVGDSHASHWRAALAVVAREKRWRGLSVTRSGCPFSRATKQLRSPLKGECRRWNRELPGWFARHREVSTVFVVQASGGKWDIPRGRSRFEAEVAGFRDAWKALPRSVKRIVVIRDTPKDRPTTHDCVQRAMAKDRSAGTACAVPRGQAMVRDAQAVAATRLRSSRVRSVDFTRFFCDGRRCFPVIGGALVHKDDHHLTEVFATTLGPYLQREIERLGPPG
jgi:peptidoglycan/LPS O-acetylase OafA/YrhL